MVTIQGHDGVLDPKKDEGAFMAVLEKAMHRNCDPQDCPQALLHAVERIIERKGASMVAGAAAAALEPGVAAVVAVDRSPKKPKVGDDAAPQEEKMEQKDAPRHLSFGLHASGLGPDGWAAWCDLLHDVLIGVDRQDWRWPDGRAGRSFSVDPHFALWLTPPAEISDMEYTYSTLRCLPKLAVVKGDGYEQLVLPASCTLMLSRKADGQTVEMAVKWRGSELSSTEDPNHPWFSLVELRPGAGAKYVARFTVPEALQKGVRTTQGLFTQV